MNLSNKKLAVVAGMAVAAVVFTVLAWKHLAQHPAHHHEAATASLDNGKRWATDEPQRAGMQKIRDAAAPVQEAFSRRQLTTQQAGAFSDLVTERFGVMAAACKLPPKADATFHIIMTDLMQAAAALGNHPDSKEAMDKITRALRQYAEYFDHPGWVGLPEGA